MLPLLTLLNYGSQISPISIPLVSGMKNIPYKQAIVQKIKNSKNPQLSPRCETIGSQINNVTDDISQFNPVINETAKARTESGNNSGTIIHGTGPKAIPNEKTSISNETRAMYGVYFHFFSENIKNNATACPDDDTIHEILRPSFSTQKEAINVAKT